MARVGYERVSSDDQVLDRQRDQLEAAGCEKVFSDFAQSGRKVSRPEFDKMLDYLRPGDALVVTELSRLGRTTKQLLELADTLRAREIDMVILNLGLDTSTVTGRMVYTVLCAVTEMEVELLRERTNDGLKAARARGRVGGRKKQLSPAQERDLLKKYEAKEMTVAEIGEFFGISRDGVYGYVNRARAGTATA
jgi:DNA invertase Pin-like site-specific DNA recombinase